MQLNMTMRRALIVGGAVLLVAAVMAAWSQRPAAPEPTPLTMNTAELANPEPISRSTEGPVVYSASPYGTDLQTAQVNPYAPAEAAPSAAGYNVVPVANYVASRRPAARRTYYYRTHRRRPRVVVRRRPFSHSAAIVAGSAGGGALIGALAGGGKGAAIGALAGGAAGYVYDRKTHKKRYVVR